VTVEGFLEHPGDGSLHPCRVRVLPEGLALTRLAAGADAGGSRESDALVVRWKGLRGFDADGSAPGPDGVERQVLAVVGDDGTLTVLLAATEVSRLFASVAASAKEWRVARSSFGVIPGSGGDDGGDPAVA
jgi:hypothetical protein